MTEIEDETRKELIVFLETHLEAIRRGAPLKNVKVQQEQSYDRTVVRGVLDDTHIPVGGPRVTIHFEYEQRGDGSYVRPAQHLENCDDEYHECAPGCLVNAVMVPCKDCGEPALAGDGYCAEHLQPPEPDVGEGLP